MAVGDQISTLKHDHRVVALIGTSLNKKGYVYVISGATLKQIPLKLVTKADPNPHVNQDTIKTVVTTYLDGLKASETTKKVTKKKKLKEVSQPTNSYDLRPRKSTKNIDDEVSVSKPKKKRKSVHASQKKDKHEKKVEPPHPEPISNSATSITPTIPTDWTPWRNYAIQSMNPILASYQQSIYDKEREIIELKQKNLQHEMDDLHRRKAELELKSILGFLPFGTK